VGDEGIEEVEPADLKRPLQRPLDQPDQEDKDQPEDHLEEEGVGDEPGVEDPGSDRNPGSALDKRWDYHPGDPVVGHGNEDQHPDAGIGDSCSLAPLPDWKNAMRLSRPSMRMI